MSKPTLTVRMTPEEYARIKQAVSLYSFRVDNHRTKRGKHLPGSMNSWSKKILLAAAQDEIDNSPTIPPFKTSQPLPSFPEK